MGGWVAKRPTSTASTQLQGLEKAFPKPCALQAVPRCGGSALVLEDWAHIFEDWAQIPEDWAEILESWPQIVEDWAQMLEDSPESSRYGQSRIMPRWGTENKIRV